MQFSMCEYPKLKHSACSFLEIFLISLKSLWPLHLTNIDQTTMIEEYNYIETYVFLLSNCFLYLSLYPWSVSLQTNTPVPCV